MCPALQWIQVFDILLLQGIHQIMYHQRALDIQQQVLLLFFLLLLFLVFFLFFLGRNDQHRNYRHETTTPPWPWRCARKRSHLRCHHRQPCPRETYRKTPSGAKSYSCSPGVRPYDTTHESSTCWHSDLHLWTLFAQLDFSFSLAFCAFASCLSRLSFFSPRKRWRWQSLDFCFGRD